MTWGMPLSFQLKRSFSLYLLHISSSSCLPAYRSSTTIILQMNNVQLWMYKLWLPCGLFGCQVPNSKAPLVIVLKELACFQLILRWPEFLKYISVLMGRGYFCKSVFILETFASHTISISECLLCLRFVWLQGELLNFTEKNSFQVKFRWEKLQLSFMFTRLFSLF